MREYTLCNHCAIDKNLIQFIEINGTPGRCSLCRQQRAKIIPAHEATNLFKALLRYHYNEWDYNTHFGGEYPETLLRNDNPIIKTDEIAITERLESDFDYDDLIAELTSPASPDAETPEEAGVWIFAGFFEGSRMFYPESIRSSRDKRIVNLIDDLAKTNYHALEGQWRTLIGAHVGKTQEIIPVGREYYRARVGTVRESHKSSLTTLTRDYVVEPYVGEKITSPAPWLASAGRLNRANVSYLYVADKSETALAEVRPQPGQVVSIGKFRVERPLRIAALADIMLTPFAVNEEGLKEFILLKTVEHALSTPVLPDDKAGYLVTQFLADIIRQLDYDGVTYRSAISPHGVNLTVFDPTALSYVASSAIARKVNSVVYDCDDVTIEMTQDPTAIYSPVKRIN